jgi:hypothetical protein
MRAIACRRAAIASWRRGDLYRHLQQSNEGLAAGFLECKHGGAVFAHQFRGMRRPGGVQLVLRVKVMHKVIEAVRGGGLAGALHNKAALILPEASGRQKARWHSGHTTWIGLIGDAVP